MHPPKPTLDEIQGFSESPHLGQIFIVTNASASCKPTGLTTEARASARIISAQTAIRAESLYQILCNPAPPAPDRADDCRRRNRLCEAVDKSVSCRRCPWPRSPSLTSATTAVPQLVARMGNVRRAPSKEPAASGSRIVNLTASHTPMTIRRLRSFTRAGGRGGYERKNAMDTARRLALILATRQEQANGLWAPPNQVVDRARVYLRFLQEAGGDGGSKETLEPQRVRPNLVAVRGS
jgi:hypothetical protein